MGGAVGKRRAGVFAFEAGWADGWAGCGDCAADWGTSDAPAKGIANDARKKTRAALRNFKFSLEPVTLLTAQAIAASRRCLPAAATASVETTTPAETAASEAASVKAAS